ncbi:MAG: hypothetical protein AMXMBFR34_26530 [Myxococcaceae bacterium]
MTVRRADRPKPPPPPKLAKPVKAAVTARAAAGARATLSGTVSGFTAAAKPPVALAPPKQHTLLEGAVALANHRATEAIGLARSLLGGAQDLITGIGNVASGAASGARDTLRTLLSDPGAAAARPIDRANLTGLDKAIVNAMGLDRMTPGQKTSVQVTANAELAAVLGVDVGAKVQVSIERSAEDPNKFKIVVGGGGSVSGKLTGDTAGAEANAALGVEATAGFELTVDLSKRGGASELAAFAAQTGAMAGIASLPGVGPMAATFLTGVQELPGVNLPGEPIDYIRRHLSAVEVGVGGKLTGVLGGTLGPGVEGQVAPYLKGGGRIEFNPDGTLTLKATVAGGVEGEVKGAVGGGGVQAAIRLAGGSAEVAFERSLVLQPGRPPRALSEGYKATITLSGDAATQGGQVKLEVGVDQLPPATRERVMAALLRGDTQAASTLIGQAVQSGQVTASLGVTALTNVSGELQVKPMAAGTGGGVTIGGQVTNEVPVVSGSVSVTARGIKLQAAAFGYPAGTELTWQQVRELTGRLPPVVRH